MMFNDHAMMQEDMEDMMVPMPSTMVSMHSQPDSHMSGGAMGATTMASMYA